MLYILLFVTDYSLLALVLPLSLFCYAQIAQHPSRLYWKVCRDAVACDCTPLPQTLLTLRCMQACLLYVEGILICQYVYQIPSRLHCYFIDPAIQVKQCCGVSHADQPACTSAVEDHTLNNLLAAARASMSASIVLC